MEYLKSLFNIENKVAVITGGNGVLGSEMADGLLKAGAKVVIIGTNEQKLNNKVEILGKIGSPVIGLKCDVLDEDDINNARIDILNRFGQIDILINAAGGHVPGAIIGTDQTIFDLKIEEFKKVTDLNLNGTILPTLIFGKVMADQQYGSIINISSMATQRAISRAVGYSAAKAAGSEPFLNLAMHGSIKHASRLLLVISIPPVPDNRPGWFVRSTSFGILRITHLIRRTEGGKSGIEVIVQAARDIYFWRFAWA